MVDKAEPTIEYTPPAARAVLNFTLQSGISAIGSVGRQLLTFATLPLLTRFMSKEEFGTVALMTTILLFVDTLSNAGLPNATFRTYHDAQDAQGRAEIIASSFFLFLGYSLGLAAILWVGATYFATFVDNHPGISELMKLIAGLLVARTLINFGYILLRLKLKFSTISLHLFFVALLQQSLSIGFVILDLPHDKPTAYFIGQLVGAILGCLAIAYLTRSFLSFSATKARIKALATYALPVIPIDLGLFALHNLNTWILAIMVGVTAVAAYEVGYRIALLPAFVISPFMLVWPTFAYSSASRPDAPEIFQNVLTVISFGSTFAALIVITFRHELALLLAPASYGDIGMIVFWGALGHVAWSIFPILSIGIHIAKQPTKLVLPCYIAIAVNIVINFLLIPHFGVNGMAFAIFCTFVILSVHSRLQAQRYYQYPIDHRRLLALFSCALVLLAMQWLLITYLPLTWFQDFALRLATLLIFIPLLLVARFVTPDEVSMATSFVVTSMRRRFGAATP